MIHKNSNNCDSHFFYTFTDKYTGGSDSSPRGISEERGMEGGSVSDEVVGMRRRIKLGVYSISDVCYRLLLWLHVGVMPLCWHAWRWYRLTALTFLAVTRDLTIPGRLISSRRCVVSHFMVMTAAATSKRKLTMNHPGLFLVHDRVRAEYGELFSLACSSPSPCTLHVCCVQTCNMEVALTFLAVARDLMEDVS
jgi:hypothetical protein